MNFLTQHLTTRNAIVLLAGAVLLQPFVTKALNTPAYSSYWEAEFACREWMGNHPKLDCTKMSGDEASRPNVVGTDGERFLKRFYF